MGIDRMHGCDDGVVKKLMTLFFDTKYRNYPFSLCTALNIINSRLTAIKPPKFIHLPILEGVMRADYFENYMRLMFALAILSYESISLEMIQTAQDLLHRFVREFQILYGIQFCTINVHQLLHLPDCAHNLGPLWVYTCCYRTWLL
ncbi:hypothetical protein PV328_010324 [Microctonus aethiopoides]|uniref:Uncharacterized protein n=1 Tax=Microctonus aethiopoides TaxID=144406 RepID=A0AA39F1D2_9HYME|nr:hypothetical protein PV328_010324 [Microctonus aethiopoides]